MRLNKLVIDVLIPHKPELLTYAEKLCEIDSVETVKIHVDEVDDRTKTVELTIEGRNLSLEGISATIEGLGGSIHSIDEITASSS
ncbi:MAG: DUF211 domain-containing protein [Dehalococcoidia bacterium]